MTPDAQLQPALGIRAVGWLSIRDAAQYAGVSIDTIRRAVRRRHLLCGRVSARGDLRFRPDHLDQWLLRDGGSLARPRRVA